MQADLPHTLHLHKDKKGNVIQKVNKNDKAFAMQEEAIRKAREKREAKARGEVPYTMEEIFR